LLSRVAVLLLTIALPLWAEELHLSAAASLTDAVTEIAKAYEKTSRNTVVLSFGASSDLSRQIAAGAPADAFFSADEPQMDNLEKAGLVRAQDRVDVLSNVLVVVVPRDARTVPANALDLAKVRTLALADPQAVPAGVYAKTWLESVAAWEAVKDKVVPTLNVRAALAAVDSGNADAGIVYRTDAALSKRSKVAFEVPREKGPAIVYLLAPLAASGRPGTTSLIEALTSAEARAVYARYGFLVLPPH
jgi:molybdate transport system substrate-binding protein